MGSANLLEEHAREKTGMPAEWGVYYFECLGPSGPGMLGWKLIGAIAPPLRGGPGKGQPNWKRKDKTTERTVYIRPHEHDAWVAAWESRTGKCRDCRGKGQRVASWSKSEGTTYRPCQLCNGTGKALALATESNS